MESNRLLPFVVPLLYDIEIDINIKDLSYAGRVVMHLDILEPTDFIKIHASNLVRIRSFTILNSGKRPSFAFKDYEIIEIYLADTCYGKLDLEVYFVGTIQQDCKGCYVSYYNGKIMISTQFEPNYARRAIPCLDEPNLKSRFNLTLSSEIGWTALSNMPGTSIETDSTTTTTFETTPQMSCYLLHFTLCNHPSISTSLFSTKITLYSPVPSDSSDFLAIAKETVEYYNELFDISYPLPKLDLVAIYKMKVRAMENWGCITFDKTCIEKLPGESFYKYFRDLRTVCHEISHMWFGNLVTMDWWNSLWLNEGFARFMEFKCLAKIRQEYRPWLRFLAEVLYVALSADIASRKTHPIEPECVKPDKIDLCFDTICYMKGGSVIRMLEDLMGEKLFDSAIREYLKRYMWKNVSSKGFFEVMAEFTKLNIRKIIETWTKQAGHPLITVKKLSANLFKVSQKPYCSGLAGHWIVPIRYATNTGDEGFYLLEDEEGVIEAEAKWIKANFMCKGVYRVIYEEDCGIIEDVSRMVVEDRYGIVIDYLTFFNDGLIQFNQIKKLIDALVPEYEYCIVSALITFLEGRVYLPYMKQFLEPIYKQILRPLWEKYGNDTENDDCDFKSLKELYIYTLLEVCNDQDVAMAVLNTPNLDIDTHYNCLIALKNAEALERCATDINFSKAVFQRSNDPVLLKAAFDAVQGFFVVKLGESYQMLTFNPLEYHKKAYLEDEFFKLLINEYVESTEDAYMLEIEKYIELYTIQITYEIPIMIEYLSDVIEKAIEDEKSKQLPLLGRIRLAYQYGTPLKSSLNPMLDYFLELNSS